MPQQITSARFIVTIESITNVTCHHYIHPDTLSAVSVHTPFTQPLLTLPQTRLLTNHRLAHCDTIRFSRLRYVPNAALTCCIYTLTGAGAVETTEGRSSHLAVSRGRTAVHSLECCYRWQVSVICSQYIPMTLHPLADSSRLATHGSWLVWWLRVASALYVLCSRPESWLHTHPVFAFAHTSLKPYNKSVLAPVHK